MTSCDPRVPHTARQEPAAFNVISSVVTVIETGTETAVFLQNRTELKPRFYASVLMVRF